jgi:HlyD family secretion protein
MWPGIIGGLIVLGLVYAFWPRAELVDIATISRAPMAVTVEDDGVTRVRDVYSVSAPVNGLVERIELDAGHTVTANETVVARLKPIAPGFLDERTVTERRASLDAARSGKTQAAAQVENQKAELALAITELDRIEKLFERGFATQAQLDSARTRVKSLQSSVAMAEAALSQRTYDVEVAQAALIEPGKEQSTGLSEVALKSPVSGKVLRRLVVSEQVVAAGTPLLELGDPSHLEIVVDFLSRDAVRITPGDRVEIKRWGGEGILNGEVDRVEPFGVLKVSSLGIEEQRVNVIIKITDPLEKWERLGHGYQLDAAVILWHADDVLKLPLSALFRKAEQWVTLVDDGGRARLRELEIGQMNTEYAQVLKGLQEGEQVIVNPGSNVDDGSRITPRE